MAKWWRTEKKEDERWKRLAMMMMMKLEKQIKSNLTKLKIYIFKGMTCWWRSDELVTSCTVKRMDGWMNEMQLAIWIESSGNVVERNSMQQQQQQQKKTHKDRCTTIVDCPFATETGLVELVHAAARLELNFVHAYIWLPLFLHDEDSLRIPTKLCVIYQCWNIERRC